MGDTTHTTYHLGRLCRWRRDKLAKKISLNSDACFTEPVICKRREEITIGFSRQDFEGVMAHDNNLMVIKVQIHDWSVKRVLIYPSSSANILY